MKLRVLFINEDMAYWRAGLDPSDAPTQSWEFVAVSSAKEAQRELSTNPPQAIIAAYTLPDHTGIGFLDETGRDFPQILRFVRADVTTHAVMLKCLGAPHQILARNTSPQQARESIHRALSSSSWLPSEQTRTLLAAMSRLPSPPDLYFRIVREMQSEYSSIETVAALVLQDPVLTAKLLQAANSASFGLRSPISNPADAVAHFGIEAVKSMVLLSHSFSYFDDVRSSAFSVESLWAHSLVVGRLAQWIARHEGASRDVCDTAFTAGLLHDMGKLILCANFPARFAKSLSTQRDATLATCEAEARVFGSNHPEVGAGLFSIWGLPPAIVEGVALHHHPVRLVSQGFCSVTAVHAADIIAWELSGQGLTPNLPKFDNDYLGTLGLLDHVKQWRDGCTNLLHSPDR